ncbi:aspartyl/asparaginyl beta-hydroxylase domain-containing protein [Pseudoxanthomonas sp. 10H]|uniref:aspartyl/asparaginyl beta-hydroxylase domain-containing protein n=1 Tax=Pseudoxanthomonas sp. 10H TaxID=3242729 RepID=UPI003557385E
MKLQAPFIQLPIRFDADRLAAEVAAVAESAWREHPQKFPGNSMLPLVAVDGDPANEEFAGCMQPTAELLGCPYLLQVIGSFGATVGRTRLMRLSGGAEVKRHADQGYYWAERVRIHVPIVTQPTVRFECDTSVVNMAAGECWIFDTWRQHRVLNADERSRIHLVCDSVGGEGFWKLVDQGQRVDAGAREPAQWAPRPLGFVPGAAPAIDYERYNVPAVMTPWELRRHLEFLLDEAAPFPGLAAARAQAHQFCLDWRGLWAAHGDEAGALPHYRRRVQAFVEQVKPLVGMATLRNELPLMPAIMLMVVRASVPGAVPAAAQRSRPGAYA